MKTDRPPLETMPVVVPLEGFISHPLHGDGSIRKALCPDTSGSRRLFIGLAEFEPGNAPHVFHRHTSEVVGEPGQRRRLTYADDFEEFYFVVEGVRHMQWRSGDGSQTDVPVKAGDAIYFPPRSSSTASSTAATRTKVLYGGTPPAVVQALD